ncbi:NAD-dependent deacetylase [Thermosporothrix hazakensis]|jgi:NAD-dependent deacetylase|uniref:NAD-dependent protein deacylase n=2 Tax=Thermosporothrix TaxID=768650 RepID=A0A326U2P0_THEHA|nr:NAD-dependent deacylase [Thermosporothrix hazakensis]PZW25693.1 NAD-dependent deacetylase [Thermosporothrix hazakensis]
MSSALVPSGLVDALRKARRVAILTGAGISAESGIPTFRDALTGLWARFNPEELATPEAFQRDPKLVWEWYAHRRELVERVEPNAAHRALVTMEQHVPKLTLITQNVDGLHQRAGSQNVLELHGNLARVRCFHENTVIPSWEDTGEVPPRCPDCGGPLRPDVVWFGENLPADAFEKAVEAAAQCDLFFSIGTSGVVEPAASLTRLARQMGATVALINLDVEPRDVPPLYQIHGKAGTILPELVQRAWPERT